MADEFTFKLIGLDKIQRALEEIPRNVAKKGLRTALHDGAVPMQQAVAGEAPKDTGFLEQHFGIRLSVKGNAVAGAAYIGPDWKIDYPDAGGGYREKISKKSGKKLVGRISVASVTRFLEFGTSKMTKNPFMTRAWEKMREISLNAIVNRLRQVVETEAKAAGGK